MTTSKSVTALLPKPGPAMVVDTFNLVIASANEWVQVVAQEKTKREEIQAWEKARSRLSMYNATFCSLHLIAPSTSDERTFEGCSTT